MNENQQVDTPEINSGIDNQQLQVQPDNLVPQHKVNAIVGSAKQKGYEKGYQDALSVSQPQSQPMGPSGVDPDTARKIAEETFVKHMQAMQQAEDRKRAEAHGMQVLNQLGAKFSEAKQRIPDFDQVVNPANFTNAPEVLHYANTVDNSGDVMYDLAKNPSKLANLLSLHKSGLSDIAAQAVKQISDSLKVNQNALQQPKSPDPLNQIKPSNIGLGNGSKRSVSDLRNDPSYRG